MTAEELLARIDTLGPAGQREVLGVLCRLVPDAVADVLAAIAQSDERKP